MNNCFNILNKKYSESHFKIRNVEFSDFYAEFRASFSRENAEILELKMRLDIPWTVW